MVRNPSFPQPNLHSTDELFVDGILLPLHLPSHHSNPPVSEPKANVEEMHTPEPESELGSRLESATLLSESPLVFLTFKRWGDIFKKGERKAEAVASSTTTNNHEDRDKDKKKERKSSSGVNATKLNINIWPFSISRSVSSAPCSRSNSTGEYKFWKWPSSLVCQVRRGGSDARSSKPLAWNANKGSKNVGGGGARARVLNLNVLMCIGCHSHLSCRNDASRAIGNGCSHEQGQGVASSRSGTFCSLRGGDDDNLRASSVL
uniref:Uncharacterized protein n=1 Tax=Nelumbo nucifera TaxID=4432 RepID=A0A822Z439_NELNU|nr:TPA_asm: hypothetical protein HUJ06_008840 [Nelumbo nucifera]